MPYALLSSPVLAQIVAAVPAGHAFWMRQVLGILACVAGGLFVLRLLALVWVRPPSQALCKKVDNLLARHKVTAAMDVLRRQRAVGTPVALRGLDACDRGAPAVSELMAAAMVDERHRLWRGIGLLQGVQWTALFFSALGTTLGVARAAQDMGRGLATAQEAAAMAASSLQVLAVGLGLAWVIAMAWRLLDIIAQRRFGHVEVLCRIVLAYIKTRQGTGVWRAPQEESAVSPPEPQW